MKKMITISSNEPCSVQIEEEILEIIPLGSGSEVGRSCLFMKFMNKKIMLDCGIHPAYNGLSSLPYFDIINPEEIDLLLITHFHLDHSGALPYFLTKTSFKGDCYMTNPTKSIYEHLLSDYIKVSHVRTEESLYDEQDLIKSLKVIKTLDFKQTINYKDDIKFTAYAAGHVLGAAMFLIEIGGIKVLYTGDFSREDDRHLQAAEIPNTEVNVLIIESTYGIHKHDPRQEREAFFLKYISDIVRNGGKCLLPVMVSGRAQELIIILEEYWEKNPDLKNVKIFYVSSLAKKCMDIFKSYINIMGDSIKKKHLHDGSKNPFDFTYITSVKNMEDIYKHGYKDEQPVVVFASPGMLQNGLSRELFDKWCDNSNNGVIITGYCVEGTLARYLMSEPKEVELSNGKKTKLNMKVRCVTFSAHSDFHDTSKFIEKLQPKKIVLVHGEGKEMKRLKDEMERLISPKQIDNIAIGSVDQVEVVENKNPFGVNYNPKFFNPQNCQKIQFYYKISKSKPIYIVGDVYLKINDILNNPLNGRVRSRFQSSISHQTQTQDANTDGISSIGMEVEQEQQKSKQDAEDDNYIEFNGIIVDDMLMMADDLPKYTNKIAMKLKNVLNISYTQDKLTLILALRSLFQFEFEKPNKLFNESIKIIIHPSSVYVEWVSSLITDRLADTVSFTVYQLDKNPNSELAKEYASRDTVLEKYKMKFIKFMSTRYFIKIFNREKEEQLSSFNGDKSGLLILYENQLGEPICEICLTTFEVSCASKEYYDKIQQEIKFFQEIV